MDELIAAFSLDRVGKAGAKFDPDKTRWFQQQYLKKHSDAELATLLKEQFSLDAPADKLLAFVHMMKERATFVKDMMTEGAYLFTAPETYDEQTVSKKWKDGSAALMNEWKERLEKLESFESAAIEAEFKAFLAEKNLGIGAVLPLFRLLVTGLGVGPSMFDIAAYLGREEVADRMSRGIQKLE